MDRQVWSITTYWNVILELSCCHVQPICIIDLVENIQHNSLLNASGQHEFFKAYMGKMTLKSNWVLHLFHVHYYSRACKSNKSTVLTGSRLSNIAFLSQQMLTPALFNGSLISNYTMKNCIVRFRISTPEMCYKVWHWSSKTYLKQPLHKKGYFEN